MNISYTNEIRGRKKKEPKTFFFPKLNFDWYNKRVGEKNEKSNYFIKKNWFLIKLREFKRKWICGLVAKLKLNSPSLKNGGFRGLRNETCDWNMKGWGSWFNCLSFRPSTVSVDVFLSVCDEFKERTLKHCLMIIRFVEVNSLCFLSLLGYVLLLHNCTRGANSCT